MQQAISETSTATYKLMGPILILLWTLWEMYNVLIDSCVNVEDEPSFQIKAILKLASK